MDKSQIILVNDPITTASARFGTFPANEVRLFSAPELNLELARAIIDEAYIANDGIKRIFIAANSFNIYAQNALLKALEEPPSGVVFIIFARMKSLLLPTIISRLPVTNKLFLQKLPPFPLKVAELNLESVYKFLKDRSDGALKVEIQSLYRDCIASGMRFSAKETGFFERAISWEARYGSPQYVLLVLLMMVLRKKRQSLKERISNPNPRS